MSNNPLFPVAVPVGVWTKIATSVTAGTIYNKKTTSGYFQTFRLTGDNAPTDLAEGVSMFIDQPDFEEIGNDSPIDIYVYSLGKDGVLRVDV
jgi:hypothetical protein